jgi:hypothetical protein
MFQRTTGGVPTSSTLSQVRSPPRLYVRSIRVGAGACAGAPPYSEKRGMKLVYIANVRYARFMMVSHDCLLNHGDLELEGTNMAETKCRTNWRDLIFR